MPSHRWRWSLLLLLLVVMTGCFSAPSKPTAGSGSGTGSADTTTDGDTEVDKKKQAEEAKAKFQFANLVEPFDPPPLEEIDAKANWQDRPVRNSLEMLREQLEKEKPLATVDEALKLKNDSPEANKKILSALGRQPESDSEVNWNAEINRHAYGDVNTVNPILISSTVEFDVSGLIGFGLFGFDWNMEPFASAETVKSWQTSEDGLMDKVVMRDDLVWSDGKPITAHDVVFSFKAILTSAIPVPAMRSGTDKLRWVEAYDDHTLVYFHKEPFATNVWNVNFSVLPKHIYEPKLADDPTLAYDPYFVKLENQPVTGGPYVIERRRRGQEIVLKARESWHTVNGKQVRDKPYFQTVRFRIQPDTSVALLGLQAGDLDELQLTPDQWVNQTGDDSFYRNNTKAYDTEWVEFHFLWNLKRPHFADKRVRKAMSYAMDYKELLERLRYGLDKQCNGVFNPASKWYPKDDPPPYYTQDLDKAEELLEAAGWTDSDGDGIRDKMVNGQKVDFEFTIITVNKQDRIDICTLLKECLDQIQIRCNVKPLEFPVVIDRMNKGDFEAAFGGWGTGTDPYSLENIFMTGKDRNYGGYSNPEVDKLFEEGLRELDPEKRVAIYQKIHKLLYEDQPYTWLFYQNAYYGFNKQLRGYRFSPRGPYNYGPGFGSIWKPAAM